MPTWAIPFERFYLGGSALTGFQLDGREIVGLRGYDDFSLAPNTGNFAINKYTAELRFPVSLNPSATIYTLTFVEAGNTWSEFDKGSTPSNCTAPPGSACASSFPCSGPWALIMVGASTMYPTSPAWPRASSISRSA
jgi:outer membrane protein assembly factor BamA